MLLYAVYNERHALLNKTVLFESIAISERAYQGPFSLPVRKILQSRCIITVSIDRVRPFVEFAVDKEVA